MPKGRVFFTQSTKVGYVAWNLSNKSESSAILASSSDKWNNFAGEDLSISAQVVNSWEADGQVFYQYTLTINKYHGYRLQRLGSGTDLQRRYLSRQQCKRHRIYPAGRKRPCAGRIDSVEVWEGRIQGFSHN